MARTKFSKLSEEVRARPGAEARLAKARAETLEEIRLYELRHREAISQATLAGRLEVTQGAVSKLEHSDDVRVSTPRQYLEVGPQAADPPRTRRRSLSGRCQHRVGATRTHQRRRACRLVLVRTPDA
jgi:DNA-binding transcriptional regulator YiaG